jgi:hypothetical protein
MGLRLAALHGETRMGEPTSPKITPSREMSIAVLMGPLVATVGAWLCGLMVGKATGERTRPVNWAELLQHDVRQDTLVGYGAEALWLSSARCLIIALCGGLVLAYFAIRAVLCIPGIATRARCWSAAPLVMALLIGIAGAVLSWRAQERRPIVPLLQTIELRSGVSVRPIDAALDTSSTIVMMLLAAAFCVTLLPAAVTPTSTFALAVAVRWQRWLSYLTAVMLMIAVVQIYLLWSWPSAWAKDADATKAIQAVALRMSAAWGLIYTTFLLAVFVTSHALLRNAVIRFSQTQGADEKSRALWLEEQGLTLNISQQAAWITAALAPALAGGPVAAIIQSFAGTPGS